MFYRAANPHGGDIYEGNIILDFSANTNPLGTPHGVIEAMQAALDVAHRYPDPYCRELTKAIAEHEGIPQEYVLCGNGAADLIYAYCRAVSPSSAVETAPTFSEYSSALERAGCKINRYLLHEDNEFNLDEDFIHYLDKIKPEAVFLCNPNNPTGRLIPQSLLEKILKFCDKSGTRLFVDECFLDLSNIDNDAGNAGMKRFLKDHKNLFILKAFTKSYGMAGVRLGYCLCSDGDLLEKMSKESCPWNVSSIAQAAGTAALRESEFLIKTREIIRKERKWLKNALESEGFRVCDSHANYLLFYGGAGLGKVLKEQCGIVIRDCSNYNGLENGWYRTAVRLHAENEKLIECIRQVMQEKEEQLWQKTL